jgi:hypothetical protein
VLYTVLQHAMHIHATVSELIPTLLEGQEEAGKRRLAWDGG